MSDRRTRAARAPLGDPAIYASLSAAAPLAILVYVAVLAILRLGAGPGLDLSEGRFFSAVEMTPLAADGGAPLTQWLMRIALDLTGWRWPVAAALVKYGALAGYHLLLWDAARRLWGDRAALTALAAAAAAPPLLWSPVEALTAQGLTLLGAAATANALARLAERRTLNGYLWLGGAMAIGLLADFGFAVFLAALGVAVLADKSLRILFAHPVALAMFLPPFAACAATLAAALGGEAGPASGAGLPSLEQARAAGAAAALWLAAPAAVWAFAWRAGRDREAWRAGRPASRALSRAVGTAAMVALAALTALAWASGQAPTPRELTPALALIPLTIAALWPLGRSAGPVLALACLAYLATPALYAASISSARDHPLALPYATIAQQVGHLVGRPIAIRAEVPIDGVNLQIALGWPTTRAAAPPPLGRELLLLWRGRGPTPPGLAPPGFAPADAIVTLVAPLPDAADRIAVFRIQRYVAAGLGRSGAPLSPPPGAQG